MQLCQLPPLARGAWHQHCLVQGKCRVWAWRLVCQCGIEMQSGWSRSAHFAPLSRSSGIPAWQWTHVCTPLWAGTKIWYQPPGRHRGGMWVGETPWYSAPWQHREAGNGLSCDLALGYVPPETGEIQEFSAATAPMVCYLFQNCKKVKQERQKFWMK